MQQGKKVHDPLETLRNQVRKEIEKNYPTIEQFCFENDISKSILSRLLSGKQKEFKLETLIRITEALGKNLEIRFKN